jgi:RNA polymerase sigma factor (TIGR02999 family)
VNRHSGASGCRRSVRASGRARSRPTAPGSPRPPGILRYGVRSSASTPGRSPTLVPAGSPLVRHRPALPVAARLRDQRTPPIEPERDEVTRVLDALGRGEGYAARDLLPLVYDELRRLAALRLAREGPGQTLQPTALVHEAYLRLVGSGPGQPWDARGHFFAAAAEAMRRIILDRARDRQRLKRGGSRRRESLDLDGLVADDAPPDDVIDLDEALGRLARVDARCVELAKLRLFAGLTLDEAAEAMGIARRTAERDWAFARAWLFRQLVPKHSS